MIEYREHRLRWSVLCQPHTFFRCVLVCLIRSKHGRYCLCLAKKFYFNTGTTGMEGIMAYRISDDCIACGACAAECPVEAISEKDGKYVIDADTCLDCGACAGVCPVEAPQAE